MPAPITCPHCSKLFTEHTPAGACPSCGSPLPVPAETPRSEITSEAVPASTDRDATGHFIPSTICVAERPAPTKPAYRGFVPDVPNHTDFELIGQGGMGAVFRAMQTPTDRAVAVKVMLSFSKEGEPRERFLNEMRALGKIKHPGIVPIFEAGECQLGPYFTMELVKGRTLAQRVKDGPLEIAEAVRFVADAADAVQAAHDQEVVHRDLKPSNMMLDDDGIVRVTDFGLAKHTGQSDITHAGAIVGTPGYMSPEQAGGKTEQVSKRSDIYSLGSTLFFLLTGRIPNWQASPIDTLKNTVADPTPVPRTLRQDLCPTLDAIVRRAMAGNPADRFSSAAAMAADLRAWAANEPTDTLPPTRVQRVGRWLRRHRVAAAVALLVPLIAAAAFVATKANDPKNQLQRKLAQAIRSGEPVTLIPETGLPIWHDWQMEKSELKLNSVDGTATFESHGHSMLVLVEDPLSDTYEFSAEVRHRRRGREDSASVGMFVGLDDVISSSGRPAKRFLTVDYTDFLRRVARDRKDVADRHAAFFYDWWTFQDDGIWENFSGKLWDIRFKPTDNVLHHENDWRKIVLKISPDTVVIQWEPGTDHAKTTTMNGTKFDARVHRPAEDRTMPNGVVLTASPFNARKPLGFDVYYSMLSIRNVKLQYPQVESPPVAR